MNARLTSLLVALALGATACGSDEPDAIPTESTGSGELTAPDDTTEDDMTIEITGNITYRQRIALRPGGTATITLEDVSIADASSTVIAEQVIELDDQQVPIPFELTADRSDLEERNTYSIRATIIDPEGRLRWTTDTANPIDSTQSSIDVGDLVMVQVQAPGDDTSTETAEATALSGTWTVTDVDGTPALENVTATLTFDADGRLSGNASCNDYSGSYVIDGNSLTVGDTVSTLKACAPEIGEQEAAVLQILSEATAYELVDANTQIRISTAAGATLTARR
jgi:putative lipoprotein